MVNLNGIGRTSPTCQSVSLSQNQPTRTSKNRPHDDIGNSATDPTTFTMAIQDILDYLKAQHDEACRSYKLWKSKGRFEGEPEPPRPLFLKDAFGKKDMPKIVNEAIVQYLRDYHLHGRTFKVGEEILDPNNMTAHKGALFAAYVNTLGVLVFFGSQIQELFPISQEDTDVPADVKELFPTQEEADIPDGGWRSQAQGINYVVNQYLKDDLVDDLKEQRDKLLECKCIIPSSFLSLPCAIVSQ